MNIDIGKYNKKSEEYSNLINKIYNDFPDGLNLPSEYAYFAKENMLNFYIRLARYKFAARILKKTDQVLEVGCGSGLGSIFLSQHCKNVLGIDTKKTEIEEGKKINKRENLVFLHQDLFDFDPSNKFDVVIALDVIEHLHQETAAKFMNKISMIVKDTGMVILGTPSIYSYSYQGALSKASHVKCYDKTELLSFVELYFGRTVGFSMNDEIVHTGHDKMSWYYLVLAFLPTGVKKK